MGIVLPNPGQNVNENDLNETYWNRMSPDKMSPSGKSEKFHLFIYEYFIPC